MQIQWWITEQGWEKFLKINAKAYTDLVYVFYANLVKHENEDDLTIWYDTVINGKRITITAADFLEHLGFADKGAEFVGPTCHETLHVPPQVVHDLLYIPGAPSTPGGNGMLDAKYMRWQARLIHLFVEKFLVPTKSSHAFVNHISAWVVYNVLMHNKVNMMQVMGYWMLYKAYTTEGC